MGKAMNSLLPVVGKGAVCIHRQIHFLNGG